MALNSPYIGHVVRETDDKIVAFGKKNDRYDIPKSEIQTTLRNVLIGLKLDDISKKYKVKLDDPLPTTIPIQHWTQGENLDLATYERKYPKGLFNKGVRVLSEEGFACSISSTNTHHLELFLPFTLITIGCRRPTFLIESMSSVM